MSKSSVQALKDELVGTAAQLERCTEEVRYAPLAPHRTAARAPDCALRADALTRLAPCAGQLMDAKQSLRSALEDARHKAQLLQSSEESVRTARARASVASRAALTVACGAQLDQARDSVSRLTADVVALRAQVAR